MRCTRPATHNNCRGPRGLALQPQGNNHSDTQPVHWRCQSRCSPGYTTRPHTTRAQRRMPPQRGSSSSTHMAPTWQPQVEQAKWHREGAVWDHVLSARWREGACSPCVLCSWHAKGRWGVMSAQPLGCRQVETDWVGRPQEVMRVAKGWTRRKARTRAGGLREAGSRRSCRLKGEPSAAARLQHSR